MNPQPSFCPNPACPSSGQIGKSNLRVHDSQRNRWKCLHCNKTFSGNKGTPFYRLKTDPKIVILVITLLAYGCPVPAIVAAFELDERTVADWQQRAGQHCQSVHKELVQVPQDLQQVQADEIRVRFQKRVAVWMAMAICVPTRLWLGGIVDRQRNHHLLDRLAALVRSCAQMRPLLLVTDGLIGYTQAWQKAFREPVLTGKRGRPRLVSWAQVAIAQTVKWYEAGRVLGIRVCHLAGDCTLTARLLPKNQVLNTAYIERINATFRQRISGLCRRTRCLLRRESTLEAAMYLVGTVYNFCTPHDSLSDKLRWRTPAMAAGLTGHLWSVGELLCYHIAPTPVVAPKRRGRPPGKRTCPDGKGAKSNVTV